MKLPKGLFLNLISDLSWQPNYKSYSLTLHTDQGVVLGQGTESFQQISQFYMGKFFRGATYLNSWFWRTVVGEVLGLRPIRNFIRSEHTCWFTSVSDFLLSWKLLVWWKSKSWQQNEDPHNFWGANRMHCGFSTHGFLRHTFAGYSPEPNWWSWNRLR